MDVVAIVALGTSVETEAPLLAADLGITLYEAGLMLRVPSPVVVLRTDDRTRTMALLGALRSRGHHVVACDVAAVASAEQLVSVQRFRLADEGLSVEAPRGVEVQVAWSDVVAIVRAVHRSRTERLEKTDEQRLSLGRAAFTGGLALRKTVTTETKIASEEREQVLYVFPQAGRPLFFAQSRTRYDGLGAELRPSQIENFATFTRLLRERAPLAAYDERLLAPRPHAERVRSHVRGHETASSAQGVDLLAHLVAMAVARGGPYR